MSAIDPRDAALQRSCPTVPAPRYGSLPDMSNGQRVIAASNGLFMQVKLDWLDCVLRLADVSPVPPLPYGNMQERIHFSFGVIPVALLEQFIAAGRAGLPNEVAGGLIYSRATQSLRLQVYAASEVSPDRIQYHMPTLNEDETIAIDLHTHGRSHAFWSATDNRDDQGIKVSGVFGNLHHDKPDAAFRLAVNGCYQPLRHPWESSSNRIEGCMDKERELDANGAWQILKWLRMR
jgi:PRTRC genetic system protein A